MSYDCLIIGGGLAGLTCGIKCAGEGLRTVIISAGSNSLHFSSGSIDLFGYNTRKRAVYNPFDYIKDFTKKYPGHPYSNIGNRTIKEAMDFFQEEISEENIRLNSNGNQNHFHVTGIGTIKPAYFSQESVFNERLKSAFENKAGITVLNFEGFRDYYAEIAVEQLKKHPLMKDINISTGRVKLPFHSSTKKNIHEFRSIDLARVFDTEKYLPIIADEIKKSTGKSGIAYLPAFIGIENFYRIHKRLEDMTGLLIYEVPTLPPSILGMRIDNALRSRFAALGGEYSSGDRVTGGKIRNGAVDYIHTLNYGNTGLRARNYLLATGSFFSNGLKSEFNRLEEPIFNLKIFGNKKRNNWYSNNFFDRKSHPFLEYGVKTNTSLNPYDKSSKEIKNLFCAGAILSGYNPIREGTGGGVAISTGYYSALKIIRECKKG